MSDQTPGSWPGLGAAGESMATGDAAGQAPPARDVMERLVAELTTAVQGMAGELKAVRTQLETMAARQDRAEEITGRLRHFVIALVISFAIDIALTGLVTFFAIRASDASAQASATVTQLHSVQISSCVAGNQTRRDEVAFWSHLAALSITSRTSAAQRRTDEQLLAYVSRAFAPVDCAARYRLR